MMVKKVRVLVTVTHFQPSLMFEMNPRAILYKKYCIWYGKVEHLSLVSIFRQF
jgi:hypothetical protein